MKRLSGSSEVARPGSSSFLSAGTASDQQVLPMCRAHVQLASVRLIGFMYFSAMVQVW